MAGAGDEEHSPPLLTSDVPLFNGNHNQYSGVCTVLLTPALPAHEPQSFCIQFPPSPTHIRSALGCEGEYASLSSRSTAFNLTS